MRGERDSRNAVLPTRQFHFERWTVAWLRVFLRGYRYPLPTESHSAQ
jgi:hypothetical protein